MGGEAIMKNATLLPIQPNACYSSLPATERATMRVWVSQFPVSGEPRGTPEDRLAYQALKQLGIPNPCRTHTQALEELADKLRRGVFVVGWEDGGYCANINFPEQKQKHKEEISPDLPVVKPCQIKITAQKQQKRTALSKGMLELLEALNVSGATTEEDLATTIARMPTFLLNSLLNMLTSKDIASKFSESDRSLLYNAFLNQIRAHDLIKQEVERRKQIAKRKRRFILSMGIRLTEIADMLLAGEHDVAMLEAFESLRKDFSDLHSSYAEYKDIHLLSMETSKKKRDKIWDRAIDRDVKAVIGSVSLEDKITKTVAKQLLPSNQRGKEKYLGLHHPSSYMKSLNIHVYDYFSWLSAMTKLIVFRREMQDDTMRTFMHRVTGETFHAFTQITLGSNQYPSGVWIHNTKSIAGEGATRVISFVDGQGNIINPDVHDSSTDLSALSIVDISYEELTATISEIRDVHLEGSDVKLAELLCNVMGFRDSGYRLKLRTFELPLTYKPKIKNLLTGELVKMQPKTKLTLGNMCITFLSILFLTEPRHALPMWIANVDTLECVAAGQLTFDHLLQASLICSVNACIGKATLRLVNEPTADLTSIGNLLASGNTAANTLSPKLRHTRKLKEMIMPACTLYFKGHSPDGVQTVLRRIEIDMGGSIYQNLTISPWFVEELDWSSDQPDVSKFGKGLKNKDRRRFIIEPNQKLSSDDEELLIKARMLTFVAPIAKMLLLREMYLEIGIFRRNWL